MEHRNSVLIVEDDVNINGLLKEALEKEGYICTQAFSGTEARMILQGERYSVILLDLMLPGIPGEEVLRDIRKKGNTPVIILTAKDTIDDKVEFLRGGADDYVTKPFDIKEVTARVEVQIRRAETTGRKEEEHRFTYQELELNKGDFTVKVGNTELPHITKQEFSIYPLCYLRLNIYPNSHLQPKNCKEKSRQKLTASKSHILQHFNNSFCHLVCQSIIIFAV